MEHPAYALILIQNTYIIPHSVQQIKKDFWFFFFTIDFIEMTGYND